ncbi:MAG: Stp1/IreP family PP2C-type Ser/Thr phosphatase [Acetobacteraceae bacterium]|nr:Stp1/IreP family PP2C-type Ser/Thr phosphatase [Acetobacteraceae bacterium]
MRWAQATEIGLVRSANEDSLCISPQIGLFAVADGMGGHRAGEVASFTALRHLEEELAQRLAAGDAPDAALLKAVSAANRRVFELAGQNRHLKGMGTTVTACLYRSGVLIVAHVGDSRAYLCRGNSILQLTEDHSLVRELVKNGGITEQEAAQHPHRNVLTRALGTEQTVAVDLGTFTMRPGDRLVLCTDGLSGYLAPEDILAVVSGGGDLPGVVRDLVNKALSAGGADNITVILVEF